MLTLQQTAVVPSPEGIVVRPADKFDLPMIDKLQKAHSKELGFLHTATLEGKLERGEILVAREAKSKRFAGYVIGSDTYFKREEVGVVYQMAVHEKYRRRQVAALLLRELFASWPRGVKLCCAWCAQDLAANKFWEAMGFVALAYRMGGGRKSEVGMRNAERQRADVSDSGNSAFSIPTSHFPGPRIHILWQKRINAGEETAWWYPSLTGAGAIREDRVVLPIPLDQHWTETRPAVLPTVAPPEAKGAESGGGFAGKPRKFADGVTEDDQGRLWREGKRLMTPQDVRASLGVGEHGLFSVPDGVELVGELPKPVAKKAARKFDPKAKQFARDLRDQWLSHVNDGGLLLTGQERYATSRQLPARRDAIALPLPEQRLLAA
jgi:ribosomal protein S18 acetylase RimI-like enzyme